MQASIFSILSRYLEGSLVHRPNSAHVHSSTLKTQHQFYRISSYAKNRHWLIIFRIKDQQPSKAQLQVTGTDKKSLLSVSTDINVHPKQGQISQTAGLGWCFRNGCWPLKKRWHELNEVKLSFSKVNGWQTGQGRSRYEMTIQYELWFTTFVAFRTKFIAKRVIIRKLGIGSLFPAWCIC